jgi:hypothetical protein
MTSRVKLRILLLATIASLFPVPSAAQLAIDDTVPIRQRQREPLAGGGGGVGLRIPLELAVKGHTPQTDTGNKTEVEFILTNSGKTAIVIPVSPHPGDLEPENSEAPYSFTCLTLRIVSKTGPVEILPGGAELYGSTAAAGTLKTLGPGDSIQVLALVTLPGVSQQTDADEYIAMAMLTNQVVASKNGQPVETSREIGNASSPQFTLSILTSPGGSDLK